MSTLKICIRYNEWICFGHISNKIIFFFSWLHRIALYFVFVYISFLLFIESNLELLKKKENILVNNRFHSNLHSKIWDLLYSLIFPALFSLRHFRFILSMIGFVISYRKMHLASRLHWLIFRHQFVSIIPHFRRASRLKLIFHQRLLLRMWVALICLT